MPLYATDINALRLPAAEGVKVMLTVQDPPAAIVPLHVFVCEKSSALAPPAVIPVSGNGESLVFVSVTGVAADAVPSACTGKATVGGLIERPGVTPVPLSATVCGLPIA
jgi:hypothetical protein